MNKYRFVVSVVAAATLAFVSAPRAEAQSAGSFSIYGKISWEPTVSGVMHGGGQGQILGEPATIDEKSWGDTHADGFRAEGGIGWGLSDRLEAIANVNFGRADADDLEIGTVAGLVTTATFDDYEYWGVEGGVRYYFGEGGFRPYVAVLGGFRAVSEIGAQFGVPQLNVVIPSRFYNDTTVATFGTDFGVFFGGGRPKFGIEAGFRYAGGLEDDDSGLEGTGLEGINDDGSRWTFPIGFVLRF